MQSWELSLAKNHQTESETSSVMARLNTDDDDIFDSHVCSSPSLPVESTPIRRGAADIDIVDWEIASHGESPCHEVVDGKSPTDENLEDKWKDETKDLCLPTVPIIKTPLKKIKSIRRASRRSDSIDLYELSADLREKTIECLEKKYGGKETANRAALQIQQCYRHWILNKSFLRMRASSNRKRSITMPLKHFEKLKKTSFIFYGPDNPVMIIEGGNDKGGIPAPALEPENSEEELGNDLEDIIKNDSEDVMGEEVADNLVKVEHTDTENVVFDNPTRNETDVKLSLSRTSSEGSQLDSQYDIIDDSQVLTVIGKEVDTASGSRISVLNIHDDDADGFFYSSESLCLDNTSHNYEPTFDKSMHKRQFRIGVNLFNWKPAVGIDYLIDNGHVEEDIKSIAEFLRKQTTISKQKISEYFSNIRDEFSMKVLLEFAKSFEFAGKGVDEALRQFQSYFKLTGEAQTVEKFLQVFSDRYVECNPGKVTTNPDSILLLAFALAMLNTDLHNQNVKRRMTNEEFLKNLKGTNDGNDFDHDMLTEMYNRIQKNEFATGADHTTQLRQIENSFVGKIPNLAATHRQFVKLFTLEEVLDPLRKDKPHKRLAFLFNDLLILAKPRGKSGLHGTGYIFSCKASYSLLGKKVAEFTNEHYKFGILLLQKMDNKAIATFSMMDECSKQSFVEELDEYIRETNGMENIRIALSKTNQLAIQTRRKDGNRSKSLFVSNNSLKSRDSGFHGMDKSKTSSLMDLRVGNSLDAGDGRSCGNSMISSSSMNDINQAESDTEHKVETLTHTGSSTSLDPSCLSDTSHNTEPMKMQPGVPSRSSLQVRKTLFGQISTMWRRPLSINSHGDKRLSTLEERRLPIPTTVSQSMPP